MGEDFEVIGRIIVDSSGAVGLETVNGELQQIGEQSSGLGGITSRLGSIFDFVWGNLIARGIEEALVKLKEFVTSSLDAAKEHGVVQAQLAQQIRDTGAATGMTADKVNQLAAQYSKLTGFTQDQIAAGETQLLMFQRINANIFPQAAAAAMDLARAKSIDLSTAFRQVGMALGDPTSGIGRLNSQFRLFDKEQLKTIEDMAKAGDVAGAQKLILDGLTATVGGAAKAYGETFAGKLDIFNAQLDELKISIGNVLIPILSKFMGLIIDSGIVEKLQEFFDAFQSGKVQIPFVTDALSGFSDWWSKFGGPILKAGEKIWDSLHHGAGIVAPQIASLVNNVLAKFSAWATANGPLIDKFITLIANVFVNVLVPAVQIAFATIVPVIENAFDIILQLGTIVMALATGDWPTAWNAIKQIATDVWKGISGGIMAGAAQLVKIVGGTPNDIGKTWSNNWNLFLDIIKKSIALAITAVQNTIGQWIQLGANIIAGLVTGIQNAVAALINTVVGAVTQTITAAQNAIGAKSPSKVFMGIGKNMMEGLALGIGDGLTIPVRAITKGMPQLSAVAALGNAKSVYYGGNTSYSHKMHFGSVNNYYIQPRQSPSETMRSLRKS